MWSIHKLKIFKQFIFFLMFESKLNATNIKCNNGLLNFYNLSIQYIWNRKKMKNQETVVILRCSTKIWYSYCDIYLDCRAFIYLFFCKITWICYCLKSSLQSNLFCDNINYLIDPVHQCYSLMYHILKEYRWCNCLFFIE